MYKSNAKIQRKIRQYSNNPELDKKVREKMKELRKKEKMRYQRSSKDVARNIRKKTDSKLKRRHEIWKKEEMKIEKPTY